MGKASSNDKSFEVEQLKLNSRFQNFMDQNSNIDHGQFFITPEPLKSTRKFLPLGGGVLDGSIGYNPSKITIATGVIDIGQDSDQYAGFVILTSESGTTDTLTTINNFLLSYQSLKLQAASGHTITITSTGNLDLSSSITLTNQDTVELFFDIADNKWKLMGGSGTGTGTTFPITPTVNILGTVTTTQDIVLSATTAHSTSLTLGASISLTFSSYPTTGTQIEWEVEITQDATTAFEITWPTEVTNPPDASAYSTLGSVTVVVFRTNDGGTTVRVGNTVTTTGETFTWTADHSAATFDLTTLDRLLFSQTTGSPLISTTTGITSDATGNLNFNVPTNTLYDFQSAATSIMTLDNSGVNLALSLFARDDEIPILQLTRTDSTPTAGTSVGRITFVGVDTTGTNNEEYARIRADAEDLTVGSVDGSMHLQVDLNSSTTTFLSLNNSNDGKLSLWKNLFFQTGIDIEMVGNDIWFDSGLTTKLSGSATTLTTTIAGTTTAIFSESDLTLQSGVSMSTDSVLHTPNTTTFLGDGTIWYSSTLSKFQARENGATVDLISTAGSSITAGDSDVTVTDTGSGLIANTVDGTQRMGIQAGRIDIATIPVFGITNLTFFDSASAIGGTITTGTVTFDFSVPVSTDVISFTNVTTTTANFTNDNLQLLSGASNIQSAALRLYRNDASPAADNPVGSIHFDGNDSATNFTNYATIIGAIESPTTTDETGSLTIQLLDNLTANATINALVLTPGELTVGVTSTTGSDNISVNLLKTDTGSAAGDSMAEINFQVFDTPTTTTYASIRTLISNATDAGLFKIQVRADNSLQDALIIEGNNNSSQFMFLTSSNGDSRMQPGSGQNMAYFVTPQVTDFSANVGTSGTLEIPHFTDAGTVTVTELNAACGSFDGAIGYNDSDGTLYVRTSATVWSFYTRSGTIT